MTTVSSSEQVGGLENSNQFNMKEIEKNKSFEKKEVKPVVNIKDALKILRGEKKRKFVQTIDLIINLKDFDVRKQSINTFIKIPNPTKKRVAGFLTKRTKLVDSIMKEDFVKYKDVKDIKKLAKKYDFFIAAAPLMSAIATTFGRVFGPMNKMPSPQAGIMPVDNDNSIKEMVDKMQKLVRIKTKDLSLKIPVGKEDMSDEEIEENISSTLNSVEGVLPLKSANIKNAFVKFTMTKPIKIKE